jgi:hypothetical protein
MTNCAKSASAAFGVVCCVGITFQHPSRHQSSVERPEEAGIHLAPLQKTVESASPLLDLCSLCRLMHWGDVANHLGGIQAISGYTFLIPGIALHPSAHSTTTTVGSSLPCSASKPHWLRRDSLLPKPQDSVASTFKTILRSSTVM